jgi:hypothetical protein
METDRPAERRTPPRGPAPASYAPRYGVAGPPLGYRSQPARRPRPGPSDRWPPEGAGEPWPPPARRPRDPPAGPALNRRRGAPTAAAER